MSRCEHLPFNIPQYADKSLIEKTNLYPNRRKGSSGLCGMAQETIFPQYEKNEDDLLSDEFIVEAFREWVAFLILMDREQPFPLADPIFDRKRKRRQGSQKIRFLSI
jgi:hypothetical protein